VGGSVVIPHLRYAIEQMDIIFANRKNEA